MNRYLDTDVTLVRSAVETSRGRIRALGSYVVGVAIAQLAATAVSRSNLLPTGDWILFNPSAVWVGLAAMVSEGAALGVSVSLGAVLFAVGWGLIKRRDSTALFVFLCVSGILALPAALAFGIFWIMDMSPAHGPFLSRSAAGLPVIVCAVTTVVPWLSALWLWHERSAG